MKVIHGNNLDVLKEYPDNYFDAVVTDPPYGLGKEPDAVEVMKSWVETGYHEVKGGGFMGKEWDAFVPQPLFWKEVFRVLKHGGHVLAFYGTRTYDWGVMAMRFAGFEVRDTIYWHYGSGFPKSHNISKAIDKMYGAERTEVIGKRQRNVKPFDDSNGWNENNTSGDFEYTAPSTEEAKQWDGWGSALKPASEPIVLARKPLEKGLSISENVLKYGTGGINIEECRVKYSEINQPIPQLAQGKLKVNSSKTMFDGQSFNKSKTEAVIGGSLNGRFPANLVMSHANYQVMNLAGNIDNHKLAEIIRYFYGYTKVSDLRERKGGSAMQNKCGNEILQSRVQEKISQKEFNTQQSSSELSELPNTICSDERALSERQEKVLQPTMQRPTSKINEGGEGNKIWEKAYGGIKEKNGGNEDKERNNFIEGKASELERGEDETSWLREHNDFNATDGLARNSEEDAPQADIHFGTQNSNGDGTQKTTIGFRECSSHQRDKERQQTLQFGNRGQSESYENTSQDRCGNGSIKERKPILEVFDFDIPAEWIRYFEYTGEQLGCTLNGLKKVKGGNDPRTANGSKSGHNFHSFQEKNKHDERECNHSGFADENGEETVEDWTCHENCPIKIMDEQSGISKTGDIKPHKEQGTGTIYGNGKGFFSNTNIRDVNFKGDSGGASRFFPHLNYDAEEYNRFLYTAKASKSERNKGLDGFEAIFSPTMGDGIGGKEHNEESATKKQNFHPTVKPVQLMRWLVRLVTPPKGIVLDPFCGSGTTGIACKVEGFDFIGIEQDAEYCKIAEARIKNWEEVKVPKPTIIQKESNTEKPQNTLIQQSLF